MLGFLLPMVQAVRVLLGTKPSWEAPSFALELVEAVSRQTSISAIDFIDSIQPLDQTPKALYEQLFEDGRIREWIKDESRLEYIKVSLANHEYVPAVQAFYHYYKENVLVGWKGLKDCPVWVDCGNIQFCRPVTASECQLHRQPKLIPFDHSFKSDKSKVKKTAILYADIHAPEYKQVLDSLKLLAKDDGFNFVLRYIPSKTQRYSVYLSGYGVTLDVKNTEYKTEDDRIVGEQEEEQGTENEAEKSEILFEPVPSIQKLTKEQIKDIAIRALSFASESDKPWDTLVQISENFPKYAHLLLDKKSNLAIHQHTLDIMEGVTGNNQLLLMNGKAIDIEDLNVFKILRMMREDSKIVAQLKRLGFDPSDAIDLLSSPLEDQESEWGDVFNIETDLAIWLNDLEKDTRYSQFPSSLKALFHNSSPSQLKFIRKNLFSTLFVVDLTNPSVIAEMFRLFQFIDRLIPIRFGIIPVVPSDTLQSSSYSLLAKSFYHIHKTNPSHMQSFLQKLSEESKGQTVSSENVRTAFQSATGKILDKVIDPKDDSLIEELRQFLDRFGIDQTGAVFFNGKFSPYTASWTQELMQVYHQMISSLTEDVAMGKLTDKDSIYGYFLTQPNVYQSRNALIFTKTSFDLIPLNYMDSEDHENALKDIEWVECGGKDSKPTISILIVGDYSSESVQNVALSALKLDNPKVRISFVGYNDNEVTTASDLETEILKKGDEKLYQTIKSQISTKSKLVSLIPESLSTSCVILINGRLVGPISSFTTKDFETLVGFELRNRVENAAKLIRSLHLDSPGSVVADIILKASGVLTSVLTPTADEPRKRRISGVRFNPWDSSPLAFEAGNPKTSSIQFLASIQPITGTGQKILSMLNSLKDLPSVSVKVFACGVMEADSEKLPLNRFYRFKFSPIPTFGVEGNLTTPVVSFSRLPTTPVLTLGLDVPDAWLVRPKKSVYDLDNIKLSSISSGHDLEAEYSLQSLLVQGHASDSQTNGPPRGLQFILGTDSNPSIVDTITMANLGYLQLKGGPGVWNFKIRPGRSDQVYELEKTNRLSTTDLIAVDSFEGATIYPLVKRRPGMEKENVMLEEGEEKKDGLWNQIKSSFFKAEAQNNKTINVFSVASGHLYERFLAIMMLSVKKQTKNPVKFWLIENYLSPSFLKFLPALSKAFQFDYELVTYKWPSWLRKQTEKQRIIWGYKILFLDVLFPLSLDKVIFVDADQVVRTDLMELVDLDLKGAVYGYTPFCSSRKEMDGFRFWNQGYWKGHLRGRAYHISALYVIDLKKFRALAAGDRLREQYQMLSADPNSLANLDQDLPNSMIHEIPMFSLPQDWLWCETWCSDESLKTAKTIDLCNNPLTKEPKLDRAKRILPEWKWLDAEVDQIRQQFQPVSTTENEVPTKVPHEEL